MFDEAGYSFIHPLDQALLFLAQQIRPVYDVANRAALRNQRYHRIFAVIAGIFGTTAILFAVAQLSGFYTTRWPLWVEISAASIALLAVLAELMLAQQTRWFLERHKAERYRLLKFHSLIEPDLWSNNDTVWKKKVLASLEEIRKMTPERLLIWSRTDRVPEIPLEPIEKEIKDDCMLQLVGYFTDKRLGVQLEFFAQRRRRNDLLNRCTRVFLPVLFFLSTLAVLLHFALDVTHSTALNIHAISTTLIVLAVSLPALAAGIRTLRSTYEFGRHSYIFQAKHAALKKLQEDLEALVGKRPLHKRKIFQSLAQCEYFLEAEHREWLRLMTDVEPYV